jgi:peptide/nickel transport system permease protein
VRYALQRLVRFVAVFLVVTFLVMVFLRIGIRDPGRTMLGGQATDAQVAAVTAKYKLDQNFAVQYVAWLKNLVTFDLGRSEIFSTDVTTLLRTKSMPTLLIGVYAIFFALVIAIPIAVVSAYRRDRPVDRVASMASFGFVAVPQLVLGVVLAFIFVSKLSWFPRINSKIYPWDDPWQHFRNFFLPVMTLCLPIAAVFTRLLRADMIITLQSDFVTLARAKGMSPKRILWRHALRASLLSVVTSVGLQVGGLLGGAVAVETLFEVDGLGSLLNESIQRRDFLAVQACAAILVIAVVAANFVIDLLYSVIDPRIRHVRALG